MFLDFKLQDSFSREIISTEHVALDPNSYLIERPIQPVYLNTGKIDYLAEILKFREALKLRM